MYPVMVTMHRRDDSVRASQSLQRVARFALHQHAKAAQACWVEQAVDGVAQTIGAQEIGLTLIRVAGRIGSTELAGALRLHILADAPAQQELALRGEPRARQPDAAALI